MTHRKSTLTGCSPPDPPGNTAASEHTKRPDAAGSRATRKNGAEA